MKFQKTALISIFILTALIQSAFAADLLNSYKQALKHDPDFQIATSQRLSISEGAAIARAGLLPNIGINGSATFSHNNRGNPRKNGTVADYSLDLKQPLFDYAKWIEYQASKDKVRAANATYAAALQELIVRVTKAYMDISQARQNVLLSQANSDILKKRLHQTAIQFKAGISKTADLDNARAAYDSSRAQLVHDKNNLKSMKAKLSEITGTYKQTIAIIGDRFPLISPNPKNLNAWLLAVKEKNLSVLAARYSAMAAHKNIQQQQAGHYPTLNATASYSGNYSKNNGIKNTTSNSANIGASLDLPIYQGGLVIAQTRQAQYDYQTALSQGMKYYREGVSQTEQAYNTILSNIDAIKIDRLAIASNQRSYKSTELAYRAGTRNMMDLLTAQQSLFSAKKTFLNDKYQYLENFITLKQAAGTLSSADIEQINRWIIS